MPTGLSDPGYGIEFQIQDPEGGPWSSLLSWAEDTTQYPRLLIGDMVEFSGYIWEWRSGGVSNETELMVTSSNIEIPSWDNPIPMDTISTGGVIAFAMECFEKGLLSVKDTSGIELRFGNDKAMLKSIELIARREGIGALLAEGSARLAQKIGSYQDLQGHLSLFHALRQIDPINALKITTQRCSAYIRKNQLPPVVDPQPPIGNSLTSLDLD